MRFVGLGDSLTQGVGDPKPGFAGFHGELEGWVEYFARAVRSTGALVAVENVAIAGARLEHVLDEQLAAVFGPHLMAGVATQSTQSTQVTQATRGAPGRGSHAEESQAGDFHADIVSCFIGVNDLWDINLDFDLFARRYNELFSTLSNASPIVLTCSIHDVFAPYPIRSPLRKKLTEHIKLMNEIINEASVDHSLVLVDLANRSDMFTRSVLAIDFLHPNRYGHQLIAAEAFHELHRRGLLENVEAPVAQPVRRGSHDLAHVAWVSGYVKRNWRRWREEIDASRPNVSRT
jgi:lysophospholipase L1-like esterase